MNIAEYAIRKKVISWMLIIIFLGGGIFAYTQLGRFEDPEYTIKEAKIYTFYPGATPREVEEEVTDKIEDAVQQLGQLKRVTSRSIPGMSEVTVVIKDKYTRLDLPQIWDELRRKVTDVQSQLPPGTKPSIVYDDYGDVYGMYFALTGDGFSYKALEHFSDQLKKELKLVPGVAKISITGIQQQQIFVEISRAKLAQLGISPKEIYETLASQNLVNQTGSVRIGDEYVRIIPSGTSDSVKAIGNILIYSSKSKKLLHLDDIATIKRGFIEVPKALMYYKGKPAIGIGISIVSGGNVVKIGEAVIDKVKSLQETIPVGIQLNPIYEQPAIVDQSVKGFLVSLLEAIAIVIVILLFFMGIRCGLIIGSVLLLTVLGTFLFMYFFGINLERISLGALVIALGMLVDNAIVVAEGILIKVQRGVNSLIAAKEVVTQTIWPLFGATLVGILAFAPISLSQDSTGEYTRSLFYVIFISLLLSWILAITVTPLLCHYFLKEKKDGADKNPYNKPFYNMYKKTLLVCIRFRWLTVGVMLALLITSIWGFGFVKQSFFPNSTTPVFLVDFWRAQGTDIRATRKDMEKIEKYIMGLPDVAKVTTVVGEGAQRFMLVYSPESPNDAYGQFIVEMKDYHKIDQTADKIMTYLAKYFPDSEPKVKKIRLGPGKDAKYEVRFSGPNAKILRELSEKAQNIMHANSNAINIRDNWRHRVKVIKPQYSEKQARATGISRTDFNTALEEAFSGKEVGIYREGDKIIPIIARKPDRERLTVSSLKDLQIWSPLLQRTVPVGQIVSSFKTTWQDDIIQRRNKKRTITAQADPASGLVSVLFSELEPKMLALKLPPGYSMEWGGEHEDSVDAQVALAKKLPMGILAMIIVVIMLFNALRQPLIIWLCVPLSLIGVTVGLLVTGQEFGFMALLGVLSLSGMLIKNAIVLIDQIDLEIREGKPPLQAIADSAVSRLRPVSLAALTTVLGMIPLLFDAFFVSMAVVIMFGLTFATVLTLIVIPVLYAIFFKVSSQPMTIPETV